MRQLAHQSLFATAAAGAAAAAAYMQGYEVMYLTDVLDEYVMQQLADYEDLKFVNIAKEDIEHLDKVGCRIVMLLYVLATD
jgi:HSP90 family molecular chaperone